MRRPPDIRSFLIVFVLTGCALPGGGGGGGGDDTGDGFEEGSSSASGRTVNVGPSFVPPPPIMFAGAPGSAGSFGDPSGSGGTGAMLATPPEPVSSFEGFTLVPGLPASCPLATADDPGALYGTLETKPCTSGMAGCAELVWPGLVPAPNELGATDPHWTASPIADDAGMTTHLIVTRRYGITGDASETIIYDLASGNAVVGLRNGAPLVIGFSVLSGLDSACRVSVVGGGDRAWLVVTEAGTTRVGSFALDDGPSGVELGQLEVDASVATGRMLGSSTQLALEAEDGEIYRVDADDGSAIATYGPDVRVWLAALAGDSVLMRALVMDGLLERYFLMDPAGAFTELLPEVDAATTNGASLAWLDSDGMQSTLGLAAPDGEGGFDVPSAPSLPVVRALPGGSDETLLLRSIDGMRMGDGRVAVIADPDASFQDSVFVLDGDGRVLGETPLDSELSTAASPLLALHGPYVWIGSGYEDEGMFPLLQRIEY